MVESSEIAKNYCFEIHNLSRLFGDRLALFVPHLLIPRGKVVMIVGESGCGKTTLLETLGLMSQAYHTKLTDSKIVFYPEAAGKGYDYRILWGNPDLINYVRLKYFSFMFQNDNLFPMYDIQENAAISRIIQNINCRESLNTAENILKDLIEENKLKTQEQDGSERYKYPNEMSCGQRQRVSCARASNKDFKVLFADEPTGNIGWYDAVKLMKLIQDKLDESNCLADSLGDDSLRITAIIVTHNLEFALKYSDQIIVIHRNGYIAPKNIFKCQLVRNGDSNWDNISEQALLQEEIKSERYRIWPELGETNSQVMEKLREIALDSSQSAKPPDIPIDDENLLHLPASPKDIRKDNRSKHWKLPEPLIINQEDNLNRHETVQLNHDPDGSEKGAIDYEHFIKFFTKTKFEDLSTLSLNSFLMIIIIIIALLSIGIGKGGLDALSAKMSNPFVRWINLPLGRDEQNAQALIDTLNSPLISRMYSVENVKLHCRFGNLIYSEDNDKICLAWGGTLEFNDPLLLELTNEENLIIGDCFADSNSYGWIITEKFARICSENGSPAFISLSYPIDEKEFSVPIPVVGIVRHLPGQLDFIITPFYFTQYLALSNPMNPYNTRELILYTDAENEDEAYMIYGSLKEFITEHQEAQEYNPFLGIGPEPFNKSWEKGYLFRFPFDDNVPVEFLDSLYNNIRQDEELQSNNFIRLFNFKWDLTAKSPTPDYLLIYLQELNKIDQLRDFIYSNFKIEVKMESIESLRNFNFISNLTYILGSSIIIISIICISIFMSFLVVKHLQSNRIFIGIFKSFGVPDKIMLQSYTKIIYRFILKNITFALIFSVVIGYSGAADAAFLRLLESSDEYFINFNLHNLFTVIILTLLFLLSLKSSQYVARRFLSHSPGDLIYDRIGNRKRTSPDMRIQKRMRRRAEWSPL